MLCFDLRKVPFSRFGSYLSISYPYPESTGIADGLYLRTVRGNAMWKWSGLLRFDVLRNGAPVEAEVTALPSLLRLSYEDGTVEFCFEDERVLRVRGSGLGLRCTWGQESGLAHLLGGDRVRLQPGLDCSLMVSRLAGMMDARVRWELYRQHHVVREFKIDCGIAGEAWEIAIEEFEGEWEARDYPKAFDACVEEAGKVFAAWHEQTIALPPEYASARELASYINWSCVVRPDGFLKRRGMLMSKNWMHAVWSWDNCFNSLALADQDPELAWEQLMLVADQQDPQGAFPDRVSNDYIQRGFVKPPIYGWTLRKLMRYPWLTPKRLAEIYGPLGRVTEWWFRWRDVDGDGIPEYFHGNDSGWDNCTLYDAGYPVKSPELLAFLSVQMDVLGEIADRLGKEAEGVEWRRKSEDAAALLVREFWDGRRFVAKNLRGESVDDPASLLSYLPVVLGDRLPGEILRQMIDDLKTEGYLLTPFGLASESPGSARFIADGYWRGAIWAPPIALIVDGLNAAGESALAGEISRRFCGLCVQSGFAENYDALTGKGLRDPAYTWTTSIFLLLASGRL